MTRTPTHTLSPSPTSTPTITPTPHPLAISADNAARMVELARWGKGVVSDVGYSPDGHYLAVQTSIDRYLYDAATFAPIPYLDDLWGQVFPPDEAALVGEIYDDGVHINRTSDGTLVSILEGADPDRLRIYSSSPVHFSPDWNVVVAETDLSTLGVWQTSDGKLLYQLEHACSVERRDMAFSPDSQTLAVACFDQGFVYLWRVSDGQRLHVWDIEDWIAYGVAFSPDSSLVASFESGGEVNLWRVNDGELLHTLKGSHVIWAAWSGRIAISPDGSRVVAGYPNGEVLAWNMADGSLLYRLHDITPSGETARFSADGQLLAVGAWNTAQVWQTQKDQPLSVAQSPISYLRSVAYTQPKARLISGPPGWVVSVAISPDGRFVVATFDDDSVRHWHISNGEFQPLDLGSAEIWGFTVVFSPDSETLAISGNGVELWRVRDWTLLKTIRDVSAPIAFSADGQFLVGVSGGTPGFWRVSDGQRLRTFNMAGGGVDCLALSPNGAMLAVANDHTVRVLQTSDGALLYALEEPETFDIDGRMYPLYITEVAFTPDGKILAYSTNDKVIRLVRTSTGALLAVLEGHTDSVLSVTFSSDGRLLASGSVDGTVRLWGVQP